MTKSADHIRSPAPDTAPRLAPDLATGPTSNPMLRLSGLTCPQCGAAVAIPHDSECALCAACGSSLMKAGGVLVQVTQERVGVTRAQAAESLQAWIDAATASGPRNAHADAVLPRTAVDDLRFFPFLKVRGTGGEWVTPLAALPSPLVAELGHAPGQMLDVAGAVAPRAVVAGIAAVSAAHYTVSGPADTARSIPDATLLEPAMAQAMADGSVSRVIIEYRGYYGASYSVEGGDGRRRAAVIGAGQGVVYGEAPPGRRQTLRDQAVFLGVAVLLIAEAAFAPGLYPRLIAVLVTAFIAFLVLAGTVVTDG